LGCNSAERGKSEKIGKKRRGGFGYPGRGEILYSLPGDIFSRMRDTCRDGDHLLRFPVLRGSESAEMARE
jgi:hypothetical protein